MTLDAVCPDHTGFETLRTKSHFGAKSTPNTPYTSQEIK